MKRMLLTAVLFAAAVSLRAGTVPPDSTIFPGQTGTQLINSLVAAYKSSTNLGYDRGRDTLYGVIDKLNDTIECVYSGYKIYMQPGQDPSTWAYDHDINCEHSWPQSMLSSTAMADLHHLFPTDIEVNGARDNNPFAEIPDNLTTVWYYNNTTSSTIPATNIDLYAENMSNTVFEPREIQKGNTARAMYYMLTMWQLSDTSADSTWWQGQKDVLYAWHVNDPADAREITRTRKIATYQQGKVNPFVLDSTLIRRAFYPGSGVAGTGESAARTVVRLFGNAPNPFRSQTAVGYSLSRPAMVQLSVYNVLGQPVTAQGPMPATAGVHRIIINGRDLPEGLYFYRLSVDGSVVATRRMTIVK
jgi:endonuclease I